MKTFLIRGVPSALQQDGWWLNGPPRRARVPKRQATPHKQSGQLWLLLALIALADQLVWGVAAGLSWAVFGLALAMTGFALFATALNRARQALIVGLTLLVLLPLVELVQPLSILIAAVGLSVVFALLAGLRLHALWRGVLRLWPLGFVQSISDARHLLVAQELRLPAFTRVFLHWFMPVMLGGVFVVLLLAANPVATRLLMSAPRLDATLPEAARVVLWFSLLPVIWTVLHLSGLRERMRLPGAAPIQGPMREGIVNAASVSRALVLFNVVFAVQTVLDAVYLYGGMGLPEGITYAQYAHRGAYPLVVTALLAGGFALVSRRWVQGDTVLCILLMIFVAQNVALVCSALVRLDLYVEVYGLTRLRMAAAIWMVLVAAGLALIFWQVSQGRGSGWLVGHSSAWAAVVIYACTWVSFDATIARYNLAHLSLAENQRPAFRYDLPYLCMLGDAAVPVLLDHAARTGEQICDLDGSEVAAPSDWREWGFRNARTRHTLRQIQSEVRP